MPLHPPGLRGLRMCRCLTYRCICPNLWPMIEHATSSSDAPVPRRNDCSTTALRKASRKVSQLFDEALAPCDMKSTQYSILIEISRQGDAPTTLQALADTLVMDRSTLGHNLRPLERDGLVSIVRGEEDRRRRHILLTPAGLQRLREAYVHWQRAQEQFHQVFGEIQASELRTTLLGIAYDRRLDSLTD